MISQRRLEEAFPGKGRALRALLDWRVSPDTYASVQTWVAQCYNRPRRQERLEVAINELIDGFGTEALFGESCTRPDAVYINQGDSYATTLLYDYTRERWLLTSYGDWIEARERRGSRS